MDEQAKLMLYKQLQEMSELNQKENAEPLVSEQEFLALSDKEVLKYTFEYRDTQTDFGENIYYLEMPDMDFSGQDLSDVRISRFMLSHMENGKRVPSKINVNGTRIAINLNGIGISEQSQDDLGVSGQVIDFSNVDFRGCEIRGILPDEYMEDSKSKTRGKITVAGRQNLDYRYLQRRKEHHLTPEERKVTERAYARLLSGETLKGTRDQDMIDFTDYDLEGLSEEQMRYLMDRGEITLDTYQIESTSRYYGIPYGRMKEATENRRNEVKLAYEKGDMFFVEEHFTELDDKQKLSVIEKEYQSGNLDFVVRHFDDLTYTMRTKIATAEYEKGNMAFVEQMKDKINIEPIAKSEIDKGNIEFIHKIVPEWDDYTFKKIVMYGYNKGYSEIGTTYFNYINDDNQVIVLKAEIDKGNVDLVKSLIDNAPRMQEYYIDIVAKYAISKGYDDFQEYTTSYREQKEKEMTEQKKQDNRVLVSDFLTHEIGLSEEEIKKLETTYRSWGRDLYSLSTERLGMQKAILDSVGGTKRAFTTDAKVLNNDPQVLYSRLMFFRESGITVMPDRLCTTLGISKKGFTKNFGGRVLEQGDMEDSEYEYKLKQELLKRYPMPETRDELKRTLDELNKEEIGG